MKQQNMDENATGVTRRDLLKMVGGAAGLAVMYDAMTTLGFAAESSFKGSMNLSGAPKGATVLVLGAGLAGMVSAYELRKAGYNVKILEYRERAGGRCWTIHSGETYTELGGQSQKCDFTQGDYMNPGPWRIPYHHYGVLDYCRTLGVPLEPFTVVNYNAYLHSTGAFGGKPQRIRHVSLDMQGRTSELLAKATSQNKLDDVLSKEDKEKLLEALKSWGGLGADYTYGGKIASHRRGWDIDPGGGLQPLAKPSTPIGVNDLLHSTLWKFIQSYQHYEYHQSIFQPVGGMEEIAKAFARELEGVITYNTKISKIEQSDKGVTVTCTDLATKAERQEKADWCVCTIPLSILSQMDVQVSKTMKTAIDAVPYETGFKTNIQFKRRFWEEDERIFGGITFTDLPLRNISYPIQGMNRGGTGVVLACYSFGPDAYKFTSMDPKQRVDAVMGMFGQIHPQAAQEFDNAMTVGWHRVPWANGCHGMWTDETREKQYNNLCQIDGRLVLAGEHTSYWPAWLEGAVLSGMDTVERLHKHILSR